MLLKLKKKDSNSFLSHEKKEKAVTMAEKLGKKAINNPEEIDSIQHRLPAMLRGPILKIKDQVQILWEAFKSPEIPVYLKVAVIGALAYLVSPIDLIPDAIPVAGLLDDAAVIISTVKMLQKFAPVIKNITTKITIENIDKELKPKIKTFEEKLIRNSLIKLAMFTVGSILLQIFSTNPFAFYGAALLILGSLFWTIGQWINNIVRSSTRIIAYSHLWFQNHFNFDATAKNILEYELEIYHLKTQKEKGKDKKTISQNFVTFLVRQWNRDKLLKDFVPTYKELRNLLIPHYVKKYIFHFIIFIGYALLTWLLIKPFLLSLSGTNMYQIFSILDIFDPR